MACINSKTPGGWQIVLIRRNPLPLMMIHCPIIPAFGVGCEVLFVYLLIRIFLLMVQLSGCENDYNLKVSTVLTTIFISAAS